MSVKGSPSQMARFAGCIPVSPSATLQKVVRERRARRTGCYITVDRHGPILISQKLSHLVDFINRTAPDPSSKISLPALHQICDTSNNRVGGWAKHRYRVRFVPLEGVREAFEAERAQGPPVSFILGDTECYTLGPVDGSRG